MRATLSTLLFLGCAIAAVAETLPPLKDGKAPQTFKEMWAGFDPRKEPLEVEVLKEWEEDGVVLKVLRYRIGIFKGKKAMMAAVYGYPKGGTKLPGLVQAHGGGQNGNYNACLTNAKRGYATISIGWAGRINAPGYVVGKTGVQLFWEGKTDDRAYKLTTDWGAVDGYHAGSRGPVDAFNNLKAHELTLDPVESPRNNGWFLVTLGARRALTFLEQQAEVDKDRLGIYGHSMGAEFTVLTAASDSRVKAAAPSCGGVSNNRPDDQLWSNAIAPTAALPDVSCPIILLNPSNDFHGRIDDVHKAVKTIQNPEWRITSSVHWNHSDRPEFEVATQLWFDQHLKQSFQWPETPKTRLHLKTDNHVPGFSVTPDASKPVLSVDIFYTQHGKTGRAHLEQENNINRFWHHAEATKRGDTWTAEIPILSDDRNLWVYANILYPLEEPITGAGYYYATYTTERFNLSSVMSMVTPAELKEAGVKTTMEPTLEIEAFEENWEKEWFYSPNPNNWWWRTHKLYDDKYQAPEFAKLLFELRSEKPNKLVMMFDNKDGYGCEIELKGGSEWQVFTLYPSDFADANGNPMTSWRTVKELRLCKKGTLSTKDGARKNLGGDWDGEMPEFRALRWIEINENELRSRLNGAPNGGSK